MSLFAALKDARERDEEIPREAWTRLFDLSRAELEAAEVYLEVTRAMLRQLPVAAMRTCPAGHEASSRCSLVSAASHRSRAMISSSIRRFISWADDARFGVSFFPSPDLSTIRPSAHLRAGGSMAGFFIATGARKHLVNWRYGRRVRATVQRFEGRIPKS
jgi:hypothetical protein